MHKGTFLLYTAIGTAIWNVVLVCLGAFAGAEWERINKYMNVYSYIAFAAMVIIGIIFTVWLLKKRNFNSKSNNQGK